MTDSSSLFSGSSKYAYKFCRGGVALPGELFSINELPGEQLLSRGDILFKSSLELGDRGIAKGELELASELPRDDIPSISTTLGSALSQSDENAAIDSGPGLFDPSN